jgi:hypothetical protein
MTKHGGRFDKSRGTKRRRQGGQKDKPWGTRAVDMSPYLWYTVFSK